MTPKVHSVVRSLIHSLGPDALVLGKACARHQVYAHPALTEGVRQSGVKQVHLGS